MFGAVSTSRSRVPLVCSVVAFAWLGAPVLCASDEEASEQPQEHFLTLSQLDVYLELEADYSNLRVKSDDTRLSRGYRSQRNTEWGFEERFGLTLGGAVWDPRLISFSGDFSFALTQDHYKEELFGWDQSDTDRNCLLQYDARVNLFQGKLISGSVYGLRVDDRINRRFQSTLDEERTGFGTSWVFAHDKIPMELSYDYLETDRTGNQDKRDDEHFRESTFHYGLQWLITEHHRLKFSYEHADTRQAYQGSPWSYETDRDLFIFEHELEFGSRHQHDVRTLVHWQEESGDFARDLFEIGPQLTLRHSDGLQTIYKYQFNRERYEGLDIESQRVDFQLVHQMYTNLTTTFNAFALYEDIEDDINTTQYGAAVDWQYNRKNPYGHLYANLALAYDTEEVSGDNGRRVILDEAHTLRDPIAAVLRNRNVVATSIVVTDAGNRRIYQPLLDYMAVRNRDVTRLVRVRNGRIADGETVLVDYVFDTPSDGQLDTIRVDFSLEQRFDNGWTPYYRFSYRNQEGDYSFGFARRRDRTDHHRLGINYEAKPFSAGAEFEVFDDTVDPYDAFHLNGMWHILQDADHSLDLSSRFSRLCFEGGYDDRDVTMVDVELYHRWQVTESLSTVERFAYRFEDDSRVGDTHGWDVTAGLEYAMGDLFGELTFDYDRLELPGSEEEDFGVYFRIRRDIPNVLALR